MNDKESTAGKEDNSSTLERLVERALANGASDPDSAESKAELVRVLLSERYSGAFPHPDVLRQFDDVIDNGAERAFALTEREQQHRHDCDNRLLGSKIALKQREAYDRRLLIILSFTFLLLSLVGSVVAIMTGHPVGAAVGGGGALVGIGAVVAYLHRFTRKNPQA